MSGPGVTSTTITLGQISTIGGPVPGLFQAANDGIDAWAAYVNANGGIAGHKVIIDHADDSLDCTTYLNDMRDLSTKVFAFVGNYSIVDSCGEKVLTPDPGIPNIQGVMFDPKLYSLANVYAPVPTPPGAATTIYLYLKQKFGSDIEKTASLTGAEIATLGKSDQLAADSVGFKYIYQRTFGASETNFTSDVLRMKSDGVRIVDLSGADAAEAATFLQEAAQQNFHPDAIICEEAYDANFLTLLGDASLADKILYAPLLSSMWLGSDASQVPAVNTLLAYLHQTHPGDKPSAYSVYAWASGTLLYQALGSAGPQLTRTSLLKTLATITNFDSDGLTSPSNVALKQGSACTVIAGIEHGTWVRVTPSSGFDCNGSYHNVSVSALG